MKRVGFNKKRDSNAFFLVLILVVLFAFAGVVSYIIDKTTWVAPTFMVLSAGTLIFSMFYYDRKH